jgi:aminoglycoside/choline kinase family phosphotransferase
MTISDPRLDSARAWLESLPQAHAQTLSPASADASFRRYFRLDYGLDSAEGCSKEPQESPEARTVILMDSPPDREPVEPFLRIQQLFLKAGLRVPKLLAEQAGQGFLLLEDFGQTTLLQALKTSEFNGDAAAPYYRSAHLALIKLQSWSLEAGQAELLAVPAYDAERLMTEMQLFPTWYLREQLKLTLSDAEKTMLERVQTLLVKRALAQPQVLVHRDFHSRNLMVNANEPSQAPGILDFQDAVVGPISYDLVSLLRDAYVKWPEATQMDWAIRYWQDGRAAGLPLPEDFAEFYKDFEYMGLQRHLKVLGIFARLSIRDGKHAYLQDIPKVLKDAQQVASRYMELAPLAALLNRAEGTVAQTLYSF